MKWFYQRRLRRAREKHAYWKARYEIISQLGTHDFKFNCEWLEHARTRAHYAGQMARYEERVEFILMEPC